MFLINVGKSVTKYTFLQVFKEAWFNTVKLSTTVISFYCDGIWPVNPDIVHESKISPTIVYHNEDKPTDEGAKNESAKT